MTLVFKHTTVLSLNIFLLSSSGEFFEEGHQVVFLNLSCAAPLNLKTFRSLSFSIDGLIFLPNYHFNLLYYQRWHNMVKYSDYDFIVMSDGNGSSVVELALEFGQAEE